MTEPRTQFEGEWADGSGKAVLDVGPLPTPSGLRVSISAEGGWPGLHDAEMRLTPREAVELAAALLTIAAPEVPDVVQAFGAGFGVPVQDPTLSFAFYLCGHPSAGPSAGCRWPRCRLP